MILTLLLSLGGALGWGLLGTLAQAPGTRLPGVWRAEAEDVGREPIRRNWCPYQKSRLVTFVATCKTEKFLLHAQQPCPQGAVDCQKVKVMYRVAHKPVYQVKQKVLASVAWRCCPGFAGSDCQHHDPSATPEPEDPGDGLQEHWDGPIGLEPGHPAAETNNIMVRQERLLRDVQNDIHHMAESLPGLGKAPASNLTAASTDANQAEPEFPVRSLEHFSPIWSGFNQSLHSLFEAIRNLSLDVEANRQAIRMVQDSSVPRADFQELSAKFETKVQENTQRVGQLQQDVRDRLHTQHLSLNRSLSEVQANVDTKLKRLLKAQEQLGSNGSLVAAGAGAGAGAGARPEPESLQARLSQLQRNLSALHLANSHRDEALQSTLADMKATLAQHVDEIKELYAESDENFEQISKVEQRMEKLQGHQQELRELRVLLMERSLVMEESKVETDRQLLELNLTLQHLQGGHADLIKYVEDCNCQQLSPGLDALPDGQGNATRAGSPVAFYASSAGGVAALQTVKFNTTHVNTGGSYFPEDGYFRAPERGVYLFAVSVEFGPGPGTGQLVFGGHHRTQVCAAEERRSGSTAATFAMAELQKGERVWFELTQGSVIKRSPPGTAFGGFLLFKT
ncbi:PREDICTED: multimerin-2 [Miniopterus natalensis]|uniref:multimerin-2 n=1 Tax=Miniopterus natalensis TaxID=291302 RepID=UPI0007A6E453|nr:PREDICTED: multimerin-2 [Miniopterus natalensis]